MGGTAQWRRDRLGRGDQWWFWGGVDRFIRGEIEVKKLHAVGCK